MKEPLFNPSEVAALKRIAAEREAYSGQELAVAYRAEREMDRQPVESLKRLYWEGLVLGEQKLPLAAFTRLLGLLGRRVEHFEGDMRAVEQQRRAEAQQEQDRRQRDEILERARPAHENLDAAVAAIFGSDWQDRVNSGDMVAVYLTDLERGTVTTKVAALREPCLLLEAALRGIEHVFRYGFTAAPSFLSDARAAFDRAVEAHVASQTERRISA